MGDVHCAVCGKPIWKNERRFGERLRMPLISRLLRRDAQPDEIQTPSDCNRPRGPPQPANRSAEIHPVAFDGKPHATTGGDAREIAYKLIDPYTIERTHNRNGRITVDTEQVSKDGKTLTVTQPGGVTRIYDKKFGVKAD